MTIFEIRVMAEEIGIEPKKKNKAELIRTIQIKEGNTPCFKTVETYCDQAGCLWKNDCLK